MEQGTELATRTVGSVERANRPTTMKDLLSQKMDAFRAVATKHLDAEKLVKIVGVAMSRTPKLMECTPMSMLNAVMTCAELGLAPSTLGTAYLIPFENRRNGTVECQLIVGYRGLMELARRSGHITTIEANVVREGDEFEYEHGLNTVFRHRPRAPLTAKKTHAWALAKFRDGSHQLVVMRREEIEAIRGRSRAGNSGPWKTDEDEMWKKTALRRLCKYLPLTTEVEQAVATVDRSEFDFAVDPDFATSERPTSAGEIADAIDGEAREVEPETAPSGKPQQSGEEFLASMEAAESAPAEQAASDGTLPGMGNAGRRKR